MKAQSLLIPDSAGEGGCLACSHSKFRTFTAQESVANGLQQLQYNSYSCLNFLVSPTTHFHLLSLKERLESKYLRKHWIWKGRDSWVARHVSSSHGRSILKSDLFERNVKHATFTMCLLCSKSPLTIGKHFSYVPWSKRGYLADGHPSHIVAMSIKIWLMTIPYYGQCTTVWPWHVSATWAMGHWGWRAQNVWTQSIDLSQDILPL